MKRYTLPLGPLDVASSRESLPAVGSGSALLRVREVQNLVPSPRGDGFVVPHVARSLGLLPEDVVAVLPSPSGTPTVDGVGLLVATAVGIYEVTGSAVSGNATPVLTTVQVWTFETEDAQRVVQSAQLGRGAVYVATERADGTPEPVLVVESGTGLDGQVAGSSLVVRELWSGLPETGIELTQQASTTFGEGIEPGVYAYRTARRLPDGSLGPATAPVVFSVPLPPDAGRPYEVETAGAVGDTTVAARVRVPYSVAGFVGAFEAALAKNGGAVPTLIGTNEVLVARATLAGAVVTLTLVEGLDAAVDVSDGIQFGLGTVLLFEQVGAVVETPDGEDERVEVLLSAPLGPTSKSARPLEVVTTASERRRLQRLRASDGYTGIEYDYEGPSGESVIAAFASSFFELGSASEESATGTRLLFTGTVGDVLAGRSYEEGHLGAFALRARRVTEMAGRLLLGGLSRTITGPVIPGVVAAGVDVVASVRLDLGVRDEVVWSEVTTRAPGFVTFVPYHADPRATEIVYYARAGAPDDFDEVARYTLQPLARLAGAAGEQVSIDFSDYGGKQAPTTRPTTFFDDVPQSVLSTGFARPYEWLAYRYREGSIADGPMLGFVSLSSGMERRTRAEFPVLGFWRGAVRGAYTDDIGDIMGWTDVDFGRGAIGPRAFASLGSSVYYVSDDGLRVVGGGVLTAGVLPDEGAPSFGPSPVLSADVSLAANRAGSREELWMSDGLNVWVLSLRSLASGSLLRWGCLARSREGIALLPASSSPWGRSPLGWSGDELFAEGLGRRVPDLAGARGDTIRVVTAPFALEGGTVVPLKGMGLSATLACPLSLSLHEYLGDDVGPDERSEEAPPAPQFSVTLWPERGREHAVSYRSSLTHVELTTAVSETGSALLPRVGDGVRVLYAVSRGAVKRSRRRLIL